MLIFIIKHFFPNITKMQPLEEHHPIFSAIAAHGKLVTVNRLVWRGSFHRIIHIDKGVLDSLSTLSFVINIHAEQNARERESTLHQGIKHDTNTCDIWYDDRGITCSCSTCIALIKLVQSLITPPHTRDTVQVVVCPFQVVKCRQEVAGALQTAKQRSYRGSCSPGYPAMDGNACGHVRPLRRKPSPLLGNPTVRRMRKTVQKVLSFLSWSQKTNRGL